MNSPKHLAKYLVVTIEIFLAFAFASPASASLLDITKPIKQVVNKTTDKVNDTTSQVNKIVNGVTTPVNNSVQQVLTKVLGTVQQTTNTVNQTVNSVLDTPGKVVNQSQLNLLRQITSPAGTANQSTVATTPEPSNIQSDLNLTATQKTTTQRPVLAKPAPQSVRAQKPKKIHHEISKYAFPLGLVGIISIYALTEFVTDRKNPKLQHPDNDQEVVFS